MNKRIRFLCLIWALVFAPSIVHCTTYYIDSTAGNDAGNGTTIDSAWQTIAKVNSSLFKPGDYILFKRGCTWREQLSIPSSGTVVKPITFSAYGTGAKPIISGADIIRATSWELYKGKIYVANIGKITSPTQLYVDGVYHDTAHHPDSGYILATADSSDTTSIISSKLNLLADQIVGATIKIRAVPWSISTATVTYYDPAKHTITLSGSVFNDSLNMRTGYGFYIENMLWMLDSPQEWYYDQAAGRLYLWTSGGDSPSGHTVEVSNRQYGIWVKGKNSVTIQDLAITKANQEDVYTTAVSDISVNDLDVSGGQNGIHFDWHTSDSTIQNCSVQNTLANGISAGGVVSNISILNNTVTNAGNVGASPGPSMAGIHADGSKIIVMNNTVTNSGYDGILFLGNDIVIQSNVVDKSCLRLDDCGGIYTTGWMAGTTSKIIVGNTVKNSMGNFSGTPDTNTQARGIYLDGGTYNTTVEGNIVYNADFGIHIHFGHDNIVKGNSFLGTRRSGLFLQDDSGTHGRTHDNVITGNTFETTSTGATALYINTTGATNSFGAYDHNSYCHPNSDYVVTDQEKSYTLIEWRQASGQDRNSVDARAGCTTQQLPPPTNLRIRQ